MHKEIIITSPPFTLLTWNQFHFVYYSLLYIPLYWAKRNNLKNPLKGLSR